MKVLIVNKFYYPRGGDCVCTLNLERLLKDNGHETAVFAMNYPENIESRWSGYFASEVKFGGGVGNMLAGLKRTLGLGDIKAQFGRIFADFRPDVVHLNNIHSYLSPVVAEMARKAGARVVWTLHDYKLLCPSYSCLRDGQPCELCFDNKLNVLKKRCMKGSLAASAVAWLEAKRWNRRMLERSTDRFIAPSAFMCQKMTEGGFDSSKIDVLCNFVDPVKLDKLASLPTDQHQPGIYCYIGRLSEEKGVRELLEVAATMPEFRLEVAGDGPLGPELRERYRDAANIVFRGRLGAEEVAELLSRSYASIIPSRCYDNNPLGVIESLCAGTPVIGARIGGIPELIDPETGCTYKWDDKDTMRAAIKQAMTTRWDNRSIATVSQMRFSPETHYGKLMKIYGM